MPKYFEVPDDFDFESLGDAKTAFKSYEPEDVSGLKTKANELLTEKKAAEARAAELEAKLKTSKVKEPDGKGSEQLQSQLEDAMKQLAEQKDAYSALQGEIRKSKINGEAAKLAASLTKDTRRAGLLAEKIGARLDIDGDKIVVLDGNGNHTISSLDDLTSSIKKDFDFLVDASSAAGGGAEGGRGGAAKTKEISRSEFDKMGHPERASFFRDGGKVVSD